MDAPGGVIMILIYVSVALAVGAKVEDYRSMIGREMGRVDGGWLSSPQTGMNCRGKRCVRFYVGRSVGCRT